MLQPFTAFDRLNAEWPSVCRSRKAAAALARWSDDPDLAGALTLDELLDRRIGCPPAAADRLLRALAARCPDDPVALRTLLQALMPGLVRLACRTRGGGEDVAGELVSLAWCRLATGVYHHRPGSVAANVLLDVRKYYMRQHRRRAPTAICSKLVRSSQATTTETAKAAPPNRSTHESRHPQRRNEDVLFDGLVHQVYAFSVDLRR